MAPDTPTRATTAWLQTGQPTARNDTKPPQMVRVPWRSVASTSSDDSLGAAGSGRMAKISPIRAEVMARIT